MLKNEDHDKDNINKLQVDEEKTSLIIKVPISKLKENSTNNIDYYLDKVGYSYFHFKMILIAIVILFCDGCEMILINISLSTIKTDFKLTQVYLSLLSSSIFIGFFLGSLVSGSLTNKFGRKFPIMIGMAIVWIFSIITFLCYNFTTLLIVRILVGSGIGIVVPSLTCLIAESIPSYNRSLSLNGIWFLYPVGMMYICIVSMSYIEVESNRINWKQVTLLNTFGSFCALVLSFYLEESPRFLFLKKRYKDGFILLNKIGKTRLIILSKDEQINLVSEYNFKDEPETSIFIGINNLISKKYLFTSILVSLIWFISSVLAIGLLYVLPQIFEKIESNRYQSLKHMTVSMLIVFPSPIFRGLISEIEALGRKNSMAIGFLGAFGSAILCIYCGKCIFIFTGVLKFSADIGLGIIAVYTSEVYETSVRSISLGLGNSITKIGAILAPFICEISNSIMPNGSFYMFGVLSIIGVFASLSLPIETIGRSLDNNEDKSSVNLKRKESVSIWSRIKNLFLVKS